jgi:hypothetical protein
MSMRLLITLALCLQMLAPAAAWAQTKNPLNYSLKEYAAVLFMTLLGGFAGWYAKVRKGEVPMSSLFALIGEMATSALAGLGAFFVCDYLGVPIGVTASFAGLCGYMGGRAIEVAERYLQKRADVLGAKD